MVLNLHKVQLPLKYPVKAAHGNVVDRPTILIEYQTAEASFWSEAPGFLVASYMEETHDHLWGQLCQHGPDILTSINGDALGIFIQGIHEQPIFKYALDLLYCQLTAAKNRQTLFDFMGVSPRQIVGSAMVGILPSPYEYMHRLEAISQMNYHAIKFKLNPESLPMLLPILYKALTQFEHVCVDANGSFNESTAQDLQLIPKDVAIEQPTDDIELLKDLIDSLPQQILIDESVRSLADLYQFKDLGVGVMLKPVCLGGPRETLTLINACHDLGIPCGISGYLDSGVGRYFQWVLAQHPKCLLRADFVWSDYYYQDDVFHVHSMLDPMVDLVANIDSFKVDSQRFR